MVDVLSKNDINEAIGQGVTLVNFNAPWCAPCHAQEPILFRIAKKFKGKASVFAINVEDNRESTRHFGIRNIPTLIIFKNGKEIQRFVGLQPESVLSVAIESLLS